MSSGSSDTSIYYGYDIATESSRYPFNSDCNATIRADPDIAGPGVMTAFIFTGWLTFFVAAIAGWYRFLADREKFNNRRKKMQPPSNGVVDKPRLKAAADQLLETLCDLQLATGTAILIAGLALGDNLNFYHEAIIASYWNLTLNSFWAAQLSNKKYEDIKDLPSFVRTSAIWCTLILSIFFQSRQTLHDYPRHGYWNPLDGDRCYRLNHDHSGEGNGWLWIVGLSIYAFVLSIRLLKHISAWYWQSVQKRTISTDRITAAETNHNQGSDGNAWLCIIGSSIYGYVLLLRVKYLFAGFLRIVRKKTRVDNANPPVEDSQSREGSPNGIDWDNVVSFDFVGGDLDDFRKCLQENGGYNSWLDWILKWTRRIFSFDILDEWLVDEFKRGRKEVCVPRQRRLYWVLQWILRILGFSLTNFLAVWSFGSASFGMETLAILGYLSWNTLDIIDAKVSNQALVDDEMSWGFGQVLPMVLLGIITFSVLDVYQDDKEREKVKQS